MSEYQQFQCQFVISSLQIVDQSKTSQPLQKKAIFVKIGSDHDQSESPEHLLTIKSKVIFDVTTNMFEVLKGIIKVYNITSQGNHVIQSVSAFTTENLVGFEPGQKRITKAVGSTSIQFTIKSQLRSILRDIFSRSEQSLMKQDKIISIQTQSPLNPHSSDQQRTSIDQKVSFDEKQKPKIHDGQVQDNKGTLNNYKKYIPDQSTIKNVSDVSISSLTFHQLYDEHQKSELRIVGEELVMERRKNGVLSQKLDKIQLKNEHYKRKLKALECYVTQWETISHQFLNQLSTNSSGQHIIEIDEPNRLVCFKYQKNDGLMQDKVTSLFAFMNGDRAIVNQQKNNTNDKSICMQIQNVYEENIRYSCKIKEYEEKIKKMEQLCKEKTKEIAIKNQEILSKQAKESDLIKKIEKYEHHYQSMKDNDIQLEHIIKTKQSTIKNLRDILMSTNDQLDQLQQQNIALTKTLKNYQLMIEQLKQQIAVRDDTLEMYEQKYGEIKVDKNRRLEVEANECLRMLNQESKLMENSFEGSGISIRKERVLSSIIKANEKIYGLDYSQIIKVEGQLHILFEKVEKFKAKLDQQRQLQRKLFECNS